MPKIEQIFAFSSSQIKDLPDRFPTRANRELNRANREAKSAVQGSSREAPGIRGSARGFAAEPVLRQAVEICESALRVLDVEAIEIGPRIDPGLVQITDGDDAHTWRRALAEIDHDGRECPKGYLQDGNNPDRAIETRSFSACSSIAAH